MNGPELALNALGFFVFTGVFKAVIQPDEMQGRSDPRNARDQVQPPDNDTEPVNQIGFQNTP